MSIKLVLMHLALSAAILGLVTGIGVFNFVRQYHQAVIDFWGDDYRPHDSGEDLFTEFPLSFILLEDGPLVGTYFQTCKDTPLPMFPMRYKGGNTIEVLCGFGKRSELTIETVAVEDQEVLDAIRTMAEN